MAQSSRAAEAIFRLLQRSSPRALVAICVGLSACMQASAAQPEPLQPGSGRQIVTIDDIDITVFTYRPPECRPEMLLLVFHGVKRNAAAYRDHAVPLADRACALVVAPEFDRQRFPRALYQYGGATQETAGRRTVDMVPFIATWARAAVGRSDLPLVLLGHSAGAQFADRVAALVPTGAAAIIVANPSTWVLPSTTVPAPYGFGGTREAIDDALRTYLAQPVTVLLGTADTGTRDLAISPEAMAQGPNRYERGLNVFHTAQEVAAEHGWRFGWTLAEVPGVAHNAAAMFASPEAFDAVRRIVPINDR